MNSDGVGAIWRSTPVSQSWALTITCYHVDGVGQTMRPTWLRPVGLANFPEVVIESRTVKYLIREIVRPLMMAGMDLVAFLVSIGIEY